MNMRQAVLTGLVSLLFAAVLPTALLEPVKQTEQVSVMIEEPNKQAETTLLLDTGMAVEEIPLEEYLVGVILSEMPVSFPVEAFKAQAVAARTFALRQMEGGKHEQWDLCADSSCCQAWSSREELEEKFGLQFEEAWEMASQAVSETLGQVMTYDGNLIDAVYFSCAGGRTEDALAVWGSEVPYLQSVWSQEEAAGQAYESQVVMTREEFCAKMAEADQTLVLTGNAEQWFGQTTRTRGGGVSTMEIGGRTFSGTKLRGVLGLRSTCFTVCVQEDNIVFQVQGYGHRVGMSQYGAATMALSGMDYRQILSHYYTGIEITTQK